MEYGKFNIDIDDGILIVTSKKNVTLDDLKECHQVMEESTGKKYGYGIYRDIIGYYDGYDFIKNTSVYCGTLNGKVGLERIKNHRDGKVKNSSD